MDSVGCVRRVVGVRRILALDRAAVGRIVDNAERAQVVAPGDGVRLLLRRQAVVRAGQEVAARPQVRIVGVNRGVLMKCELA